MMTYEKQSLPGSKVELIIRIAKEELTPHAERALDAFRKELELPGFRKGEVPRDIARSRISKMQIWEKAALYAASEAFAEIVKRENLEIVDSPELIATKLVPEDDVEFKAVFTALPEFSLPDDWRNLAQKSGAEKREVSVGTEEIEKALVWLQQSRAKVLAETGGPAGKGDLVCATIESADGTLKHYSFVLGSGILLPGVEDEIAGLRSGETKEFTVRAPRDYWSEALRDKDISFRVALESVKHREVQELNDEFARSLGRFKDLEDLRANVKRNIFEKKRAKERERLRILMLENISGKIEFSIPDILIEREINNMLEELRLAADNMGLSWEIYLKQIGRQESELRGELRPQAEVRVRYALILRAVADEECPNLTDNEVNAEMNRYLSRFRAAEDAQSPPIDLVELRRYTRTVLRNEKAFQILERIAGV